MRIKSILIKPIAKRITSIIKKNSLLAESHQQQFFHRLINKASHTQFGVDHGFQQIEHHADFKRQVPIRDYEALKPYIEKVRAGERDILWPGRPKYFAKTSGTTSGAKYIPITRDSMPNHFNTARNALFCQATRHNAFRFVDGKMIFLSGSPRLEDTNGIPTGRLSGIVNHAVPRWLRKNQLPSYQTNCIEDWDKKIEQIIVETSGRSMTLISGIPPWVKDYFERLLAHTGSKNIGTLFPELQFVVHGGVNFEPYQKSFDQLIGRPYFNVETYPASEGFIAFQDAGEEDGLLLNTNSGIFFEFIQADKIFDDNPERLSLSEVELQTNYAIILTSNAGLWAYNIGDTIEFVSLRPFRIRVTGRIKHFISAFGEHVIAKEIEQALLAMSNQLGVEVSAFTVAPKIGTSENDHSFHQWVLESKKSNLDVSKIANLLDTSLQRQNTYYEDLRVSQMLKLPEVVIVQPGLFSGYMKSIGKQGGQNKVPILSNDRTFVEGILNYDNN